MENTHTDLFPGALALGFTVYGPDDADYVDFTRYRTHDGIVWRQEITYDRTEPTRCWYANLTPARGPEDPCTPDDAWEERSPFASPYDALAWIDTYVLPSPAEIDAHYHS